MGYETSFRGRLTFDRPLDDKTYNLLYGLAKSTRWQRKFRKSQGFGIDGEFYIPKRVAIGGQDVEDNIVNDRVPPRTQPGFCLQWIPSEDRMHLDYDRGGKFYGYVSWLEYLIARVLRPAGIELSGSLCWMGDVEADTGTIIVDKCKVTVEATDLKASRAYESCSRNCDRHDVRNAEGNCAKCLKAAEALAIDAEVDAYYYGEGSDVDMEPLSETTLGRRAHEEAGHSGARSVKRPRIL